MFFQKSSLTLAVLLALSSSSFASASSSFDSTAPVEITGPNETIIKPDGEGYSYFKKYSISVDNGSAFSVKNGPENTLATVKLNALDTRIQTNSGIAMHLDGPSDVSVQSILNGNNEIDDKLNKQRSVWLKSKDAQSLVVTNGGKFVVEGTDGAGHDEGDVTFDGSVEISNNGSMEMGFGEFGTYKYFPVEWKEGEFDEGSAYVRTLRKIDITGTKSTPNQDGKTAALRVKDGALVLMGASKIHIKKGKADYAVDISNTSDDESRKPLVIDIFATQTLKIDGDINLDLTQGIGKGYIRIGCEKNTIINGNIYTKNIENSAGTGRVDISLKGAGSKFTGSIHDEAVKSGVKTFSLYDNAVDEQGGHGTFFSVSDGAQMDITGDSTLKQVEANGAVINANSFNVDISKTSFNGDNNTINMQGGDGVINLGENQGNGKLDVNIDCTTEGCSIEKAAQKVKSNNSMQVSTHMETSTEQIDFVLDASKGEVSSVTKKSNEVLLSLNDIASNQMLAWRNQINDVNKRLGDLRAYGSHAGSWARVFGGKSEFGDRNVENEYTTIQVGADAEVKDDFYIGLTAHYMDGKGSLKNGTTEDNSYGLGVYGGWLADDGQFVDVIVKRTRLDSDFDLRYKSGTRSKGDFHTWGTSVSVEYGWRLSAPATKFWVEPQLEVSYGHLEGTDYTTSAGVRAKQDSMDSLIGRLGVALGRTFDNGSAYVKGSVAHEFEGESKATMQGFDSAVNLGQDLSSTFGELALGGTVNLAKNFYGYGEFQTTFGSPVKSPYQWTAGVRCVF